MKLNSALVRGRNFSYCYFMHEVEKFLKKYSILLQLVLCFVAVIFLSLDINRPLVDYDEATYAHVIVDTLNTGNFLTLQLSGQTWFEKPPLYLWSAMASVKLFGEHEFAFRLPGIIASIVCCWLVYLLVKRFTEDEIAAAFGFLALLLSNAFFVFAREVRLDSAVTASILASLYFWIKGLDREKNLLFVLPFIAIGIMFKSVIGLLVLPIILIYSILYKQWSWLRNKYFWIGVLPFLLILLPWHLWETYKFGEVFWNNYLGVQVFHRATATMTGTDNYYDYVAILRSLVPWIWVLVGELIALICVNFVTKTKQIPFKVAAVFLLSSAFFIVLFTIQKSHLGTYIIPVFPLLAISIVVIYHDLSSVSIIFKRSLNIVLLISVLFAAYVCLINLNSKVPVFTYDEKNIGLTYKQNPPAPFYSLDWNVHETVNYYGDTIIGSISPSTDSGKIIRAPFYLFVDIPAETYFFYDINTPDYPGLKILYQSKSYALIYGSQDLTLPQFHCCSH